MRTQSKSILVLIFAFLAFAATALAAPGDGHWDRQFAMPGTATRDFAMAFHDNKLYVAGVGLVSGQIATNTVVNVFDGTNWSTIGDLTGGLPVVEVIAFLGNDMYVGGTFSAAGGVPAAGLAKWDGTNWSALGFAGVALAINTDGTNLYVGGSFTNAGGVASTNFAKWDGTNWSSLGGGIGYYTGSTTPAVNAVVWHNGLLYIGGNFTNAGPTPVFNLAVWNGSAWAPVGGGVGGANDTVTSLEFFGDDLYVGGQFNTAGGVPALNIAHWNGSSWSALGSGLKTSSTPAVNGLAFLGTDLYATGNFTNAGGIAASRVAKWDGNSWANLGGLNGTGNRILSDSGLIYLSGSFNLASNVIGDHVIGWDGSHWFGVTGKPAQGTYTFVQSLGFGSDGLYMGGTFTVVGTTLASRIARWDGNNWNALAGGVSGAFNGFSVIVRAIKSQGNNVYVGGDFSTADTLSVANIAYWDGANWQPMGYGVDSQVNAIDANSSEVYVGGFFTNALNVPGFPMPVNNIAQWSPDQGWLPLGSGVSGTVASLAVSGSSVYVGGSFTNASGVIANRIALWDGSSWSSLGTGTANGLGNGSVNAILVDGSDVYVGGSFTNAGGAPAKAIAKWNGSAWSALGSGMFSSGTASINSLAKIGSYLYVGGIFTNAGGIITRTVARWNGSGWEAMGSGVGNENSPGAARCSALVAQGNDLYVGGIFETAGVIDSGYIAHWNDQIDFTPPSLMRLLNAQLLPGPMFKFRVTATERANYVVEQSSDLIQWNPFMTNSAARLDLSNSIPGTDTRYFRMREIP